MFKRFLPVLFLLITSPVYSQNMNYDEDIYGVLVRHCDLDYPGGLRETDSLDLYNFNFMPDKDGGQYLVMIKKPGNRFQGFRRSLRAGDSKKDLEQHIKEAVLACLWLYPYCNKLIVVYKTDKNYCVIYKREDDN